MPSPSDTVVIVNIFLPSRSDQIASEFAPLKATLPVAVAYGQP
jgi:hypothetical protein